MRSVFCGVVPCCNKAASQKRQESVRAQRAVLKQKGDVNNANKGVTQSQIPTICLCAIGKIAVFHLIEAKVKARDPFSATSRQNLQFGVALPFAFLAPPFAATNSLYSPSCSHPAPRGAFVFPCFWCTRSPWCRCLCTLGRLGLLCNCLHPRYLGVVSIGPNQGPDHWFQPLCFLWWRCDWTLPSAIFPTAWGSSLVSRRIPPLFLLSSSSSVVVLRRTLTHTTHLDTTHVQQLTCTRHTTTHTTCGNHLTVSHCCTIGSGVQKS